MNIQPENNNNEIVENLNGANAEIVNPNQYHDGSKCNLRVDPTLQEIFGSNDPKADDQLKEKLYQEGALSFVIATPDDGTILDGHRVYKFCREQDLPFKVVYVDVPPEHRLEWVVRKQTSSRNLTVFQRVMIAMRFYKQMSEEASDRKSHKVDLSINSGEGKTSKNLGELVGLSASSIDSALQVVRHGVPELFSALEMESLSLDAAKLIALEPAEVQIRLLGLLDEELKVEVARLRKEKTKAKTKLKAFEKAQKGVIEVLEMLEDLGAVRGLKVPLKNLQVVKDRLSDLILKEGKEKVKTKGKGVKGRKINRTKDQRQTDKDSYDCGSEGLVTLQIGPTVNGGE